MPEPHDVSDSSYPEPALPETGDIHLRLEREKLELERERLSLERERMEAERKQWRLERELLDQTTSGLHVGMGVFGLAVASALVVAGVIGFNAGMDVGRHQAPLPRHVVVGRHFMELLSRTQPISLDRPDLSPENARDSLDLRALYRRPRDSSAAGNLVLTK